MYELDVWGQEDIFEPPTTIAGKNFSEFLELCLYNADIFSLNKAVWTNCVCKDLQKELDPFLEREIQTIKWFGYDYSAAPIADRRTINVYIYRADIGVKDIIVKYCSDIFLRIERNGEFQDSNHTLEDLCFFSEKKMFAGTVSHEFLLNVDPPNKEFEDLMRKVGSWNYVEQNSFSFDYS